MPDKIEIKPVVCDSGLFINDKLVLVFNSNNNAELVKAILIHEQNHPNEAMPYIRKLPETRLTKRKELIEFANRQEKVYNQIETDSEVFEELLSENETKEDWLFQELRTFIKLIKGE